jgi:hypothetical protein
MGESMQEPQSGKGLERMRETAERAGFPLLFSNRSIFYRMGSGL